MNILDTLFEPARQELKSGVISNLESMFESVNTEVGSIAAMIGESPQTWSAEIFNLVKGLSDTVIVPIAGMILTYVFCYEIITTITDKNSMHDVDTYVFFKYIFKMAIAVYIVSHCFEITMAIFEMSMSLINSAAGLITGTTDIDISTVMADIEDKLTALEIPNLAVMTLETFILSWVMKIISFYIMLRLYSRMIEIYINLSIAPIPYATFGNREWSNIGNNYIRTLLSLGFQGFFYLLCVGIYAVLIKSITVSADIMGTMFSIAIYTVILVFSMNRVVTISKALFGAH
jgi:hypothetical protein